MFFSNESDAYMRHYLFDRLANTAISLWIVSSVPLSAQLATGLAGSSLGTAPEDVGPDYRVWTQLESADGQSATPKQFAEVATGIALLGYRFEELARKPGILRAGR